MNNSPVKKEASVKEEPSDSVNQTATPNVTVKSEEQGWQDIPLKCCTKEEVEDTRYHILKFQSKQNVDICKDFTRPVRMHRKDPRNIQFQLTRKEIDQRKREEEEENMMKEKQKQEEHEAAIKEAIERGEDPNKIKLESEIGEVAPDGGARKSKKSMFKRKTRQINLMDDSKRKLRYEEYYPWVLEDYDGKNMFVGNYEAGLSDSQLVLFVFDKDGFKMVPAEKVYKFTPRNKYATLTLEEAEAKMEKNSSVPRWLMRHMEDKSTTEGTPDQRFRHTALNNGRSPNAASRRLRTVTGAASSNDRDSDHDDLDFDEEFADDEEAPIMDGDEEENKLSEQKIKKEMLKAAHFDGQSDADINDEDDLDDLFETEKSRKVDKEGKKLRKVLNKTEGGVYESEDEDDKLNPYLSKSDLESDSESENDIQVKTEQDENHLKEGAKLSQRIFSAYNMGDAFVQIKAPSSFLNSFPSGEWVPGGRKFPVSVPNKKVKLEEGEASTPASENPNRSRSPLPAASTSMDLNSAGPDNILVTVNEVIDIVRNNPLTTKELLFKLKGRVNAHKDNKLRIISIVKQNLKLVDGKLVLRD